ncbi:hypothetical protein BC830DRAFT_8878 [Chytriomyces sp. MP71]|nr:hypothetical protein BC830DRAFT_8878 [Chytriomyces sp. MP71]
MSRGEGTACLDGFADYPINISDTMPSVGYGVSRSGENSGGESVNTSSVFVTASASPALSTRQKHALLVQQRRAAAAGGSRAAAAADALGSDSDADDADIVDTNIHFTTGLLNAIGGAELPAHVDIARLSILPVGLGSGTGSSSGLLGASNPHAAGRPQTNVRGGRRHHNSGREGLRKLDR